MSPPPNLAELRGQCSYGELSSRKFSPGIQSLLCHCSFLHVHGHSILTMAVVAVSLFVSHRETHCSPNPPPSPSNNTSTQQVVAHKTTNVYVFLDHLSSTSSMHCYLSLRSALSFIRKSKLMVTILPSHLVMSSVSYPRQKRWQSLHTPKLTFRYISQMRA